VFHGSAGLAAVAARRWKTQVNENSKAPAYFGVQPEVCHNEVCGFGQNGDVTRQLLTLVNLRSGLEDARLSRRFDLFAELTSEALAGVVDVEAAGEGELARFFDLVMIGDFVSLHLAGREGVDPGPVPTLDELKLRLTGAG
jgi:glucose/mannose-6-phosphate isomerase